LELQTSDFEPAAESAPETPSNSKPEVGFLNPEPLATRCITKDNDGPGEGSLAALRSSWIQRLFPGMLGESVRPSQWKDKEKHIAPDYENNERLLIENTTKLAEDSGPSPQLLGVGQESRHGDLRPVKREEGSSMDIVLPCTNSSPSPRPMLCRQGLPPAREAYRAVRGFAGEIRVKSAMDIGNLSENSQELTGLGSQQASVDLSANSTRFTKALTCNRLPFDYPIQQNLHAHDVGYSQIRDKDYAPNSIMEQEAEQKMKAFLTPSHILPAEADTRSMQVEHHPVQRHPLSTRDVIGISQQQEQYPYDLNDVGTSNRLVLQGESSSLRFRKSGLQPGGIRNIRDTEYLPAGRAGGEEGLRVDNLETDENIRHQGQYGQNVVSLESSPLPPLSLFAPFKHNKERRSIESQGKNKMAASLSEDSLLTPLFPSCGYKSDPNDNLGGADVSEDKFGSTLFAPYYPLSSFHHSTGLGGIETPLTLTPIFAPFKTLEEQNRPSTSAMKTNILPFDRMEQSGEDAVGQDSRMDLEASPEPKAEDAVGQDSRMDLEASSEPKAEQTDHRGQLSNQLRAYGSTSSVYSRSPLPVIANQSEAAMFSLNSGPRFNEGQYCIGTANFHGSTLKGRRQTVSTTAIELNSRRPSLQEHRIDDKDLFTTQSHDIQLSVSQGKRQYKSIRLSCQLSCSFVNFHVLYMFL
jgi:hypothetical protein